MRNRFRGTRNWLFETPVPRLTVVSLSFVFAFSWTTLDSVPKLAGYMFYGGSAAGKLAVIQVDTAHELSSAGVWATISKSPTLVDQRAVATNAITGKILLAGGGLPTTVTSVDELDIATAVWTVKRNMPSARRDAAGGMVAGQFFVCGGTSDTDAGLTVNEKYDTAADTWVSAAPLPGPRTQAAMYCENGMCYLAIGGTVGAPTYPSTDKLEAYAVAADAWTTKQAAPVSYDQAFGCGVGVAHAGVMYTCFSDTTLGVYTFATDQWTSLSQVLPAASGRGAYIANDYSLELFVIGHFSPLSGKVHKLTSAFSLPAAMMQGDPMVTTFAGLVDHVDLHTGVFNIFASTNVVVNALLEPLPGLPVAEDMVMTAVVVMTRVGNKLPVSYCTSTGCDFISGAEHLHSANLSSDSVTLTVDGFLIEIHSESLHIVDVAGRVAPSNSSFLDLLIRPLNWSSLSTVAGIIGDSENRGFATVRDRIGKGYYTAESGCLYSYDAASANVFWC